MTTSMNGISPRIVSRQRSVDFVPGRQFHNFFRKFRSHDTVSPNRFAVCTLSFAASAPFALIAGVMPVM